MDFKSLFEALKADILDLVKDRFDEEGTQVRKDIENFLEGSKDKLMRWTLLLEQGALTPAEFELLLKSQKDLLVIQSLQRAGISKIKIGLFKNEAIKIIVNKAVTALI